VVGYDALTVGDDEPVFVAPRSRKHMHNTAPRGALLTASSSPASSAVHRPRERHTFNKRLRQYTREGVLVRSLTGHASEDVTARYSHLDLEEVAPGSRRPPDAKTEAGVAPVAQATTYRAASLQT